jgi:hypothetical protein
MSCPNGAVPLLLPIENVTVSDSGKAIARGIAIGLGNPMQVLSLVPSIASDDLFVTSVAECGNTSNDTCIGTVGGVYSSGKSSSYVLTTKGQWNGTKDYDVDGGSYVFFNDELRYGQTGHEDGYPAYMNEIGNSELFDQTVGNAYSLTCHSCPSRSSPGSEQYFP